MFFFSTIKVTGSFSLELIASHLLSFLFFFQITILRILWFWIELGKRNSIKMIPASPRNQSVSNARLLLLKRQSRPSPYPRLHSASCYLSPVAYHLTDSNSQERVASEFQKPAANAVLHLFGVFFFPLKPTIPCAKYDNMSDGGETGRRAANDVV